mgnify:FL=1
MSAHDGAGCRALELGCGLRLPALRAADAGCDVTATDSYDDALRFARRSASRNPGRDLSTRLADWRAFPGDLGGFDLVPAADVLYEWVRVGRGANASMHRSVRFDSGTAGHQITIHEVRLG